jgi:hypothetical protein
MTNTYQIAVSPQDGNHDEVEQKFAQELNQFRSGKDMVFYHGGLKTDIKVHVEVL